MRPLLFTDIDDVLCLNRPYGGYDVARNPWPADLLDKLWHRPALDLLEPLVGEFEPLIVITSSWLRFMPLSSINALFRQSDAAWLAEAFHPVGEAPQTFRNSRLNAVDVWLRENHRGEPYAILDDALSGTGLVSSRHDILGRLILCEVDVGLLPRHAEHIRLALSTSVQFPHSE